VLYVLSYTFFNFRSAFAATASPKDKDVVIILDASSSMKQISGDQSRSKMVIAKEAARTVIQTLNPNDRVWFFIY
jgi:hypothetical protein